MEDVGAFLKLTWNTIYKFYFKEILEYLQEHHFDAGLAVVFVACVVYYSREELYSQGRFEWRNLGLELSWTELGLGLLIECVILVLEYIAAKLASQNETLSSEARITNQGENAGPGLDQTSSTEASNEVNLPTQYETPSHEDRSTSQKENERPSPAQSDASDTIDGGTLASQNETPSPKDRSASQRENERPSSGQNRSVDANNGGKLHQIVLNRCRPVLVRDLDYKAIHNYLEHKELFDDVTRRDISEQPTTTEKNQYLIDRLKGRGKETYETFKECLVLSNQKHLKDQLEQMEEQVALEME